MLRLNVGCGTNPLPDFVNLDIQPGPGVDLVVDIQQGDYSWMREHGKLGPNLYDEMLMSHVFEHLHNPLAAMENLWTLAKPGCKLEVRCPWGASAIAFEDPTHLRQVFLKTFFYFSQCAYGAANYGYKGDWSIIEQIVYLNPRYADKESTLNELGYDLMTQWNIGEEIIIRLEAIKPARPPGTPAPHFNTLLLFRD